MNKTYHISIPQPCHESWKNMSATPGGVFCSSCKKEVIDFTLFTDTEIIAYVQKTGAGCGRFRRSQLNRELVPYQPQRINRPFNRLRTWIAGSLALLFTGLHFPLKAGTQIMNIEETNDVVKKFHTKPTSDTVSKTIRGIVEDEDGTAIPGAVVQIKGTSIYTQTDIKGEFILEVPANLAKKRIRIVARFLGYSAKEVKVALTSSQAVNIRLCIDPVILGGIAMINDAAAGRKI